MSKFGSIADAIVALLESHTLTLGLGFSVDIVRSHYGRVLDPEDLVAGGPVRCVVIPREIASERVNRSGLVNDYTLAIIVARAVEDATREADIDVMVDLVDEFTTVLASEADLAGSQVLSLGEGARAVLDDDALNDANVFYAVITVVCREMR